MAIHGGTSHGYISRVPTAWFDPTRDWTDYRQVRAAILPTNGAVIWNVGPLDYSTPYFGLYFPPASTTVGLYADDHAGQGYQEIFSPALGLNTYAGVAVRYTRSSHTLDLLVNGVVAATMTYDLSAFANPPLETMLSDGGADEDVVELGHSRRFNAALSTGAIAGEAASPWAVQRTALLTDTPLPGVGFYRDQSGNGRDFTASGTVSDAAEPYTPPNQTDATALPLYALDTVCYQRQDFGGITAPCWYSFDVSGSLSRISARAYGDFSTWVPGVTLWRGTPGSLTLATGGSGADVWNQAIGNAAERLYLRVQKRAGNIVPALTTIQAVSGINDSASTGDLVHPDSSTPYPAVVVNTGTGLVKGFIGTSSSGWNEVVTSGILRSTGRVAVYDFVDRVVKLYDPPYTTPLLSVAGLPLNVPGYIIGTNGTTGWWAVKRGIGATNSQAYFIDPTGTVTAGPYDLGTNSRAMNAVTPNLTDTVLYFAKITQSGNPSNPIWQIVLNTQTVTTFLPGGNPDKIGPFFWNFLQTLADGTVIIGTYTQDGTNNRFLIANTVDQYNASGTLLRSWSLGSQNSPNWFFTAPDNPTSFWVWTVPGANGMTPDGLNRYWNIVVATASLPAALVVPQFSEAVSQESGSLSATPFGTDVGGAPWIAANATTLPAGCPTGLTPLPMTPPRGCLDSLS